MEMRKASDEHAWFEHQATNAAKRVAALGNQHGSTALGGPPQYSSLSAKAQPFEQPSPGRQRYDRPLTVATSKHLAAEPAADLGPWAGSPAYRRPRGVGGPTAVSSLRADAPVFTEHQYDVDAVHVVIEDLHRIQEQLAAIKRISTEADELLEAMVHGTMQTEPRLKNTLVQLMSDCERLQDKGERALSRLDELRPSSTPSANRVRQALPQAAAALRQRIAVQLRMYWRAEGRSDAQELGEEIGSIEQNPLQMGTSQEERASAEEEEWARARSAQEEEWRSSQEASMEDEEAQARADLEAAIELKMKLLGKIGSAMPRRSTN